VKEYQVRQYEAQDFEIWNTFVSKAKNATFLFHRDFMEYHKDRFEDFSLLVFEQKKLVAILPANRVGDQVFSHQGLTYGGLVYTEKIKLIAVIDIFEAILFFLNKNQIKTIQIKTIPSIYHKKPAEEMHYVLFLAEAKLNRRDTLSVIDMSKEYNLSTIRKRGIKKGNHHHLVIEEVLVFDDFWNKILIPNLVQKYHTKPVHSLDEIKKLKELLPKNIRQFNVYDNNTIVAGTTIFESDQVAHAQYISGNDSKNTNGSLDFLFNYLVENIFKKKNFFDFGISNELNGKKINGGLLFWKESFGASTIVQDFYEVETANYYLLENRVV
jgi:hypothetical protein